MPKSRTLASASFWAGIEPSQGIGRLSDDAFGCWLAGFADGEGSFQIVALPVRQREGRGHTPRFTIALRADDAALLLAVQERTGLGSLSYMHREGARKPAVSWTMSGQACVALAEILDEHPLQSKKARDYAIWRQAVCLWDRECRRQPSRCCVEGCDQVVRARGLCNKHWFRWRKYGDPPARELGTPVGRGLAELAALKADLQAIRRYPS